LPQVRISNVKSRSGTGNIELPVPLLFPKFVSEGAAMDHELRKRGTRLR
jgi:hypothetical protein